MYLLLHEDLPLRTTRMLGDFADDKVLPHRLGDLRNTRFSLIKLTDFEWFAADHAMEITDVQIDDESTASWVAEIRTDDEGHTWTVVVLGAPAPPDSRVTASGIGRKDPRTGRLYANPADLMEYVLGLAGRSETFPILRAEAAAEAIELAGSLDELKHINLWLDEIAYSAAAIWTPTNARLYPTTTVSGGVRDLDRFSLANLKPTSDVQDTTDVLRVSYNVDGSNGRARAYVELSARPMPYEGITTEVTLAWVRTATNAESIGRRMMHRMAGQTVAVDAVGINEDGLKIRPCDWVRVNDHPGWPFDDSSPVMMMLAASLDADRVNNEVALEVTLNSPAVVVSSSSIAVPFEIGAGVDLSIANGVATIGVTDDKGKPLPNAWVSLDNGAAKKTNAQGKVQFEVVPSTPPRKHQLAVEAPGMTPFLLDLFF